MLGQVLKMGKFEQEVSVKKSCPNWSIILPWNIGTVEVNLVVERSKKSFNISMSILEK